MSKKLICVLLVLALALSAAACGQSGNSPAPATQAPASQDNAASTEKEEPAAPTISYPEKTITVIVPFGAGGDTDLAARIITDKLSQVLDCTIVIENVGGGSGVIGHTQMLNSAPDGYTLMINQLGSHVTQTQLGNTTYEYDDSTVIAGMGSFPQAFVVPADSEWDTFQEMIDWAKENPGKLTYGTQGVGGLGHTCALDAFTQLGVTATDVAFGTTAESVTAVLGGHVMTNCAPIAGAAPYIDSGELKLLALSNTFYMYPDAPVVADFGCTEGMYSWVAMFAPGGLDEQIRQILIDALEVTRQDPTVVENLKNFGIEANFVPGDEYKEIMEVEYLRNQNALRAAGLID